MATETNFIGLGENIGLVIFSDGISIVPQPGLGGIIPPNFLSYEEIWHKHIDDSMLYYDPAKPDIINELMELISHIHRVLKPLEEKFYRRFIAELTKSGIGSQNICLEVEGNPDVKYSFSCEKENIGDFIIGLKNGFSPSGKSITGIYTKLVSEMISELVDRLTMPLKN